MGLRVSLYKTGGIYQQMRIGNENYDLANIDDIGNVVTLHTGNRVVKLRKFEPVQVGDATTITYCGDTPSRKEVKFLVQAPKDVEIAYGARL